MLGLRPMMFLSSLGMAPYLEEHFVLHRTLLHTFVEFNGTTLYNPLSEHKSYSKTSQRSIGKRKEEKNKRVQEREAAKLTAEALTYLKNAVRWLDPLTDPGGMFFSDPV